MKKVIIGALVGGLIIFIWQFLSYAAINFHRPAQQYTEKQEEIMNFLNNAGLKEGGYFLPNVPDGASAEDHNKLVEASLGKPWATIQYHAALEDNMVMNMIRGFLVNVIVVFLFLSILRRISRPTFGQVLGSAIMVGLIVFLNGPYTGHIWYQFFDTWAHLLDAIVSWALVGAWLGWWMRRGENEMVAVRRNEREAEMV